MKKFNKIFVCGLSRTGTKSLGDYLKLFDLTVVHNGGQIANPLKIENIDALLDDKQTQFLYEVLNEQYPNSLFIYTNRNTKSWVDKIISWKPNSSYIYHQLFSVDGGVAADTKEMLTSFKEEHFSRFQLFSNKLPNERVLYLELEDSNKAKKVCEFLGFEHSDDLEYPNIKYR
jgi:hypothetical protein|tara:strand:+ start:150 stop:668 length:519 start_codon:yes stop_codon:yes gene_type:complete